LYLVLLIFIPLFVIIFYYAREQKQRAQRLATENVFHIASNLAEQQKFIETNTRQLLTVLSQLPEIKNIDTLWINHIMASLLEQNRAYASMLLVNLQGEMIASGLPFVQLNVSDRQYFKDVIRTKAFTVGEYTRSRLTHKPVLHYAYPVLNNDSSIKSVLIVSFDLKYYDNILKNLHRGDDAAFTFVDRNGIILYHSSKVSSLTGVSERREIFDIILGEKKAGTFNATGNDSIRRLYGYQRLTLNGNEPYMSIYIGIPEKMAYAEYRRTLTMNIIIWVLAAIFMISSSYIFSRKYIIRPIDQLVKTAGIIAEGNFEIRTGINNPPAELGSLAMAIDEITEKLFQREIERKKVGKDFKKLKERFELAINSANIGIWDWHIRNNVVIWGKNMFELYGILPESFNNTLEGWKEFIHPEDLSVFEAEIQKAIDHHQPFRSEFRIVNTTFGLKYIRIFASVIDDKENKPVRLIGVNWDITERKKLEYQLNEAKDNAEIKNRLKSAFLANVSHEIRTPLHGIIGFAQILKDNEITSLERMQYLDIIVSSGNKLLNIISNIIDISMLDSGELKIIENDCKLYKILHDVYGYYEKIRIKERKQIGFVLDTDIDEEFSLNIDGYRFNQVLFNLVDNAFKNTERGEIRIGCHIGNDELICYVKDTGIGIDSESLSKIFDHIKKLEDSIKGNNGYGLGLAICKGLVELMGGHIWVISKDSGSEFHFALPLKTIESQQNSISYGNNLFA